MRCQMRPFTRQSLLLVALCCIIDFFENVSLILAEQSYPAENFIVVKPNAFELRWDFNASHIMLQVKAKTVGFVGLGIAEQTSGSMPGSDIAVVWVDSSGTPHVEDYYAMGKYTPIRDDCDNWLAVDGSEDAGWTTVDILRLRETNDPQDRPIPVGMAKLVWAYSPSDSDTFSYHSISNRGPFGAPLLGPVVDELLALKVSGVETFDFLNDITRRIGPNQTTVYRSVDLVVPFDSVHIIGIEHLVRQATKQFVHHFVLYGCEAGNACAVLWAWAPGGVPFVLPATAGIRVGRNETFRVLTMTTHYDSPNGDSFYDDSGLKIYYTFQMRQHDAVAVQLGDVVVTNPYGIPAGATDLEFQYDCPGSICTTNWPVMTAFSSFIHMHQLGQQIWLTHWRGDTFLGDLHRIDFWDFAFQSNLAINRTIQPGDSFRLHCTFTNPTGARVPFRDESDDEMCLAYAYVFPAPAKGTEVCSYLYTGGSGNKTYCNNTIQNIINPSKVDPPGGQTRRFGMTPPSNYICPTRGSSQSTGVGQTSSESTSAGQTSSQSTSAGQTSSQPTAQANFAVRFIVLLFFVAGPLCL